MKPILEWYEDLPEPYRSQAIENYNPEYVNKSHFIFNNPIAQSLFYGFVWADTKQGYQYWNSVTDKAISGEFDKHK